jgi:hypothetical protein
MNEGYIIELKPKDGLRANTYQLTNKACLATFFYDHRLQEILDKANENNSAYLLLTLLNIFKKDDN